MSPAIAQVSPARRAAYAVVRRVLTEGAWADRALLGWFMWMFEVKLADGRKVHAYKHIVSRDYLHLTHDGRAFVFRPAHSYVEVDLEDAVAGLFARWWTLRAPPAPPD